MSLCSFWEQARLRPDHVAIVDAAGEATTASELLATANRLVHGLRAHGLQPGDTIAAMLGNEPAMLELYLAVAQAGWYLIPINWHLTAPEVAYILEDSGSRALVCSGRHAEVARDAAEQAGLADDSRFCTADGSGLRPYAALTAGQPADAPPDRRTGGPMQYTSGTTGRPKGVRRPLAEAPPDEMANGYASFLCMFGIEPQGDGVHLVGSPLYHTAVLNFAASSAHLGHTLVLMDTWAPEASLERIERHRVTHTHMVPTQFVRLLRLDADARSRYDVSSLRQVVHSAAPCPVDVKRQMLEWWGPVVYEYYAATEGGGTLATPEQWAQRPGTVGSAWPMSQIEIVGDEGQSCPPGEIGTVWMSMGGHRFEYHKDRGKTSDAWREDGFFTVGDAGYLDEDGFLFLVDRKSDMIISGGVNIYPAEIEAALILHPEVADVAVFGIPDDDWGEQVKAVIEPIEGVEPGDALGGRILEYARERLAKFKCPKSIDFAEQLPRDPNGKLYKRKLRDPYWEGRERSI